MIEGVTFCGLTPAKIEQARRRRGGQLSKWGRTDLTWWIGDRLPGVPYDQLVAAYTLAFAQWQAVCGLTFTQVKSQQEADFFVLTRSIDGPSGVLAEHQLPNGSDRPLRGWFDSGERWDADGDVYRNDIDLVAVACHEFGHGIGLDHLSGGNLLAPTYDPRVTKPQDGDIAEAQKRYGPPIQNPSTPSGDDIKVVIELPVGVRPGIYRGILKPE